MASGSVIQEFLIGLGVKIDVKEFFTTIGAMEKSVAKFTLGLEAIADGLRAALIKTASALEKLYYIAQNANTSVASLRDMQYAMSMVGLNAEDASQALEGLASAMRVNPGNESLLRMLGVQTREAGGATRDTTKVMGDFIARLNKMPFYVAAQYAAVFGINERTLYMLLKNFGELQQKEQEWRNLARQTGVDLDDSAKKSHAFMNSIRELGEVIDLMWIKVSTVLIGRLKPEIDQFVQFLLAHNKEITKFAIDVGNAVLNFSDDMIKLLPQIDKLITSTLGWKVALEGIADIVAYRILGPIGLALTMAYQLYKWLDAAEAKHPGPKHDESGNIDRNAPETKKFFEENKQLTEDMQKKLHFDQFKQLWDWFKSGKPFNESFPPNTHGGLFQKEAYRPGGELEQSFRNALESVFFSPRFREQMASGEAPTPPSGQGGVEQAAFSSGLPEVASPGSGALGERNNNPGNLRRSATAIGSNSGFAVFRSAMDGLTAMRDNLLSYAREGRDSVMAIIQKWAPASENNTRAYIAELSRMMHVDPGAHLNMQDPAVMSQLMQGIARIENGYTPYDRKMYDTAAQAPTGGARHVTVQQKTDIHVHGGESHSVGQEVGRQQEQVNASLVRDFRTAILA